MAVAEKNEFVRLSEVVSDHLVSIQDALREYQHKQQPNGSVSQQLQSVLKRVRSIEVEAERTRELLEAEKHKSNHDELTGLPNRSAYNERAFHELRRFKRYHRPLTLAVCDIDFFKNINDKFGHSAGDKSLKLVAKYIASKLRTVDFVARLGGEEFVMILPETTEEQAFRVLDKMRASVSKIPFKYNQQPFQITVSLGISEFASDDTMETVFERADRALYAAKTGGRNQSCIESQKKKKAKNNISHLSDSQEFPKISSASFSKR